MKKLMVLLLVLAMASVASAMIATFRVAPGDVKPSYEFSDVITIEVFLDMEGGGGSFGITLDLIGDHIGDTTNPGGGAASAPLVLNPGFDFFPVPGTIVNSGGDLISGVSGITNFGSPTVDGVLYSFEYHVPDLPDSTIIVIGSKGSGINEIDLGYPEVISPEPVEIHITPEPMTVALLGLGGLFLRRRK